MMIDQQERLWLFWPTILANTWESCFTNLRVSSDYMGDGPPQWHRSDVILLKPDDFSSKALEQLDQLVSASPAASRDYAEEIATLRKRLPDKLYQRLGWQPRCKPTVLESGRILLPLYTDTFSISIMAISDDDGSSWFASEPLMGFGNIQPAVLQKKDGTLVAFMRENGWTGKIRLSHSDDQGMTWGAVTSSELPNPGSGLDAVKLRNGNWLIVYNDSSDGRSSLAVSVSDDEGASWKWTRRLEDDPAGRFHYPAVIQAHDGTIHVVYSYFVSGGKSMKHVALQEEWIQEGPLR